MPGPDINKLRATLDLLRPMDAEAQLLAMKNLCENNGVWSIPSDHTLYSPVMYEISLWGISASATAIDELPTNWQRAARNFLNALTPEEIEYCQPVSAA